MQRDTLGKAVQLNKEHRRRKRWHRVVSSMAAVVVFVTTYALILPAITMEQELICGMEEHAHTAECRGERVRLACSWVGHTHEASCYDESGELCCGYADFVLHTHEGLCYDENGTLVCRMEERKEHIHSESCYEEVTNRLCGMEETEGHIHSDSCFGDAPLICETEESEEHSHEESCFGEAALICGEEETPAHFHDEECGSDTERELICGQEEIRLHSHDETCFDEDGVPVCGSIEILAHQHDGSCLAAHVHESSCYDADGAEICGGLSLVCGMEEHTHSESCHPDDGAVNVTFTVAEEYLSYIESSHTFPLTVTLQEGTSLADRGGLPAVIVTNGGEETALYEPKYHWVTDDGTPVEETAALEEDLTLQLRLYTAEESGGEETVTAVFACGETILLQKEVPAGTVVSELVDEPLQQQIAAQESERHRFTGWVTHLEDGSEETVKTGITEIWTDTVYRAKFRDCVLLTLHDIGTDGNDAEGSPREQYLPYGGTLSSLKDVTLSDGTAVADCLWQTAEGAVLDGETPVTADLTLYTYSYELLLRLEVAEEATEGTETEEETEEPLVQPVLLFSAASAEEDAAPEEEDASAEAEAEEISIVKRSGDALTESDFLVDGVNYTDYQWVDEEGNDVSTAELLGAPLGNNQILVLAAGKSYTIQYKINVSQTVFGTSPTVGGATTLNDTYNTADGTYTIRVPNPTRYMVESGNKKTLYQFTGWKISRNSNIVEAGETVDASWASSNLNRRSQTTITLTAQWTAVVTTETVHFFVNLNCQVADVDGNTGIPSSGEFTHSVYSTTTTVTGASMKSYWQGPINSGTQFVVLRADNASDTEAIDREIRRLITGHDSSGDTYNGHSVWKDGYKGTKIFQVNDFPSDEQVLSVVRSMVENGTVIRMNGVALKAEELTADNFTVRWNVFKYDTGDGWHIDGVLVGKQAHITVKKTFLGDDEAVRAVKDGGFTVRVDNTSSSSAGDILLTLNPAASETGSGRVGYESYDARSDTYTWSVPLEQENRYSIIEQNYLPPDDAVQTTVAYTVNNSPDAFAGWRDYPTGGISNITAYAYANDVSVSGYQTVALRNAYVKSDTLTISKLDMATGNGLAGVSYRLSDSGGNPLTLYQRPGESYYSTKEEDAANGFVLCDDSIITTGSNGTIFLKLDGGTFTLEEAFPTGYGGASVITVTVGPDSNGNIVFEDIRSTDSTIEVDGVLVDANTATLTVRNVSHPTSVTAEKVWVGSDTQPVTVALYRNGVAMGEEYQVTLNSSNGWTHTWDDLPLYADGAAANYSLREIRIGTTNYDPSADADGYPGYIVAYDAMKYYQDGEEVSGPVWVDEAGVTQYADNARLVVRNEVYRGQMVFLKVDGNGLPLAGAVFRLYRDEAQTELLAEATSDAYGRVIFEDLVPNTYYVVKETGTPEGYIGADSLYKVRLSSLGSTLVVDSATGETLTAIVNYADTVKVTLHKISELGYDLADAQFRLERQSGDSWEETGTLTTAADGLAELGELEAGTYRLQEIHPPDGFTALTGPIVFTVGSGTLTLSETADCSVETVTEGEYLITVINRSGYELPGTGGITPWWCLAGGLLLSLSAAVLLGCRLRRRREETF